MKQTAVEWLVKELNEKAIVGGTIDRFVMNNAIEQAKEMENEQQENIYERERFRAIDFTKWFADFNDLTWEEKRVSKEHLNILYDKYLRTLGGTI